MSINQSGNIKVQPVILTSSFPWLSKSSPVPNTYRSAAFNSSATKKVFPVEDDDACVPNTI